MNDTNTRLRQCVSEYAHKLETSNNLIKELITNELKRENLSPDSVEVYLDLAEIEITCKNNAMLDAIVEYLIDNTCVISGQDKRNNPNSVKLLLPDY